MVCASIEEGEISTKLINILESSYHHGYFTFYPTITREGGMVCVCVVCMSEWVSMS